MFRFRGYSSIDRRENHSPIRKQHFWRKEARLVRRRIRASLPIFALPGVHVTQDMSLAEFEAISRAFTATSGRAAAQQLQP
jgi:hypothetical protein